jgi:hypothetical protein
LAQGSEDTKWSGIDCSTSFTEGKNILCDKELLAEEITLSPVASSIV